MSEGRVLVVEDEPMMQRLLKSQLTARGYQVMTVGDGLDALAATADYEPRLVLLDVGLPGMNGLDVCKSLREWWQGPIVLLSAHDATETKASALDNGADDYVTKPFHMTELLARMRAVLRRTESGLAKNVDTYEADGLKVDLCRRTVMRDGAAVHVTKTEFDLLSEFVRNADRVLTYTHLLSTVWGSGYDDVRLVHVHACNLRRALEGAPGGTRHIISVPGIGYRFQARRMT